MSLPVWSCATHYQGSLCFHISHIVSKTDDIRIRLQSSFIASIDGIPQHYAGPDRGLGGAGQVLFKQPRCYSLMYSSSTTGWLDVLESGDNRHGIFPRKCSVLYLDCWLSRHAVKFLHYVVMASCLFLYKAIHVVVDCLSKYIVHWFDDFEHGYLVQFISGSRFF